MIGNFGFNLLPNLDEVDWEAWERYFPDGMGASVFSSPGWQRLMQNLLGSEFELKMLVGEAGSRRYTLPIYVRRWRYRRLELVTHPTAYYMLPIESETADTSCIPPLLSAARAPLTLQLKWWLPPWITGDRSLMGTDVETYLIEIEGDDVDAFLHRAVRRRFLEQVRTSYRRGIEVVERPTDELMQEYVALYHRTHDTRQWCGDRYGEDFFRGIRHGLGDAGRLVVLRHGGAVVGGGVVLFDRYAAHYFQGAVARENNEVKPHLVLYDWIIRAAAARGLRFVNLGGINFGNQSLAEFKMSWGARAVAIPQVRWSLNRRDIAARLGFSRPGAMAAGERPSVEQPALVY